MAGDRRDGPLITAARLFEKQSAGGNRYFVGRWGGCRVLVLKSRETAPDGTVIWSLCLQEAPKPAGDDGARR